MLIFSLIRYTRKWHRAGELARRMPGENVAGGVTFQLMCTAVVAWEETRCVYFYGLFAGV